MSIQTELTRLTNAKAAIKAAIEGKGVTVPDGTLLDGMAALIGSIEAGGGGVQYYESTLLNPVNQLSFLSPSQPNVVIVIGRLLDGNVKHVGFAFHMENEDGTIYQEKRRYQSTKYIIGTSVTDGSLFTISKHPDNENMYIIKISSSETSYGTSFYSGEPYKILAAHI